MVNTVIMQGVLGVLAHQMLASVVGKMHGTTSNLSLPIGQTQHL